MTHVQPPPGTAFPDRDRPQRRRRDLSLLLPPRNATTSTTYYSSPTRHLVPFSELLRLNRIGSGCSGTVYMALQRTTGRVYALKVIYGCHEDEAVRHRIHREIQILRKLDHPNVIKCHDVYDHNGEIQFLLEFMDGGSLEGKHIPNEQDLADLALQILSGLAYLHRHHIVHREIKPSNLLVNTRKQVKIADFGVGRILNQTMDPCNSSAGSIAYTSPDRIETVIDEGDDDDAYAGDIWSLGVCLLELYMGKFPFAVDRQGDWTSLMRAICMSQPPEAPPMASSAFRDFVSRCLQRDPERRWTASRLLDHPFITQAIPHQKPLHPLDRASSAIISWAASPTKPTGLSDVESEKLKLGHTSSFFKPRKRRRATTTLITTSLPDFRQKVQEFTGARQNTRDALAPTLPDLNQKMEEFITEVRKDRRDDLAPFISHCCLFPFGYEFAKDELVTLWIAEGFFQIGTRQDEDAGNQMFDLLVSSGIVILSRSDQSVDFFHHKTRNLLYRTNESMISSFEHSSSSAAAGYVRLLDGNTVMDNVPQKVLHLSVDCKTIQHMGFESMKRFQNLHTLFVIPATGFFLNQVPRDIFLTLRHLRSLNLSRSLLSELPSSIGNLKSLQYIDLSYTPIRHLPDSICTLHKLQTLRLRGCLDLAGLPKGTGKLTSLRHLDLDIIRQLKSMPPGMGNLTDLQTLSAFLVGTDDGCRIGELKNTINLTGTFCISRIENVSNFEEAKEADLINKKFLRRLELRWTGTRVDDATKEERILQHLQPPLGLEELSILYYSGFKLPSWISDPSYDHLVDITLYNCINCQCLPPIGQLPSLQFLHIKEMNELQRIDDQFCRDGKDQQGHAFPSLKELTIEAMPALEEWMGVQNGDFPRLHKLKVENCPKLISLPLLSCLYSLKHLEMSYCPNISSLPDGEVATSLEFLLIKDCSELKKHCHKGEGKDWGRIAHVPNIFIDDEEISCQ